MYLIYEEGRVAENGGGADLVVDGGIEVAVHCRCRRSRREW
jgi:hypothetical protein